MKRIGVILFAIIMGMSTFIGCEQKENTTVNEVKEVEQIIDVGDGKLAGSLVEAEDEQALAIIIPGSGPTDRNGNNTGGLNTNCYKKLATALAAENISTFRYDKRMVGASTEGFEGGEEALTFDDVVEDVVKIADQFPDRELWLIGHSEGSLIAILAAQQANVNKVISLAGPGEPIGDIIRWQLVQNPNNPPDLIEEANRIIAQLEAGETVEEMSDFLAPLFRPSVQPYMISWMKYNPAEEVTKLTCPVVLIQGDQDIQVEVKQGEMLAETAGVNLQLLEGMNHVLVKLENPAQQGESYQNPDLPLHPDLIPAIVGK